ncbi:MAG: ABC transporter ATP-binding protein [Proteobacteria bacterium]|nr:ABC transporter ATP-binding protein [Pseudomonadota bacterium]
MTAGALLEVDDLAVHLPIGRSLLRAVDGVSLSIGRGETLGLIGESGSGKTTIGRAILRRAPVMRGRIRFDGVDITRLAGEPLRRLRRRMQPVMQDPYASLNPRMTIGDIVREPLEVHGLAADRAAARAKVASMLRLVGLPEDAAGRYPHAFSGGQRQRIGIARALTLEPDLIVADEPVSALDVSIRAQIVNLMQELQQRLGTAYLFIAHDLVVVRHISHRIAILYCGQIVETASREAIYGNPRHPYTEALLSAILTPLPARQRVRGRIVLKGEIPNPTNVPTGCRFHTRCPYVEERCRIEAPPFEEKAPGHWAACWLR